MIIFISFILGSVALLALLYSIEESSFSAFILAVILIVGIISLNLSNSHSTPQKQDTAVVIDAGNTSADNAATDDNSSGNDDSNTADDNTAQKQDSVKNFDWQKWAKDAVSDDAIITCNPDGIQVYVTGSQNTDATDDGPSAIAVWPRLHQNGIPFTCGESKDPTKEIKR